MRLKNLLKFGLLITLSGCGVNQQNKILEKVASFPKDTCAEQVLIDAKKETITFYPVFVDDSEINAKVVSEKYCERSYSRDKDNKKVIRVASFLNEQEANQFKDILKNELGSGELGKPKVINLQDTANHQISSDAESIGKAAKLSTEQLKQIINVKVRIEEGILAPVKVALPTYFPPGFEVDKLEINDKGDYGQVYEITYRNTTTNETIYITGGGPLQVGGADMESKRIEVSSPAFGKLFIYYKDPAQVSDDIRTSFSAQSDNNYYYFQTPWGNNTSSMLPLQEAVKMAESIQYLNR